MDGLFPPGALEGVRVVEFAQAIAVPFCGLLLADMGATVIKVEPPAGDGIRYTQEPIVPGESKGFIAMNRGKQSLCLDVTRPEARPVIEGLVRQADIVLVSLKPADLPRYRLQYEDMRAINPGVIFLEHVPLGHEGPFGGDPGADIVVQGIAGVAALSAITRNGVPQNIRPPFNDMATGCLSALGVVAALRHRERTGEGQRVETSLLSSALAMAAMRLTWVGAVDPPREEAFAADVAQVRAEGGGFDEQRMAWERHFLYGGQGNLYFRNYRTLDGFVSVGALTPPLHVRFRNVTGLADPREEPGYDGDRAGAADLARSLTSNAEALFATQTTAEWVANLRAAGVPCGPVNFPPDVQRDPQIAANGYLTDLEHPIVGGYRTFSPPIRMDATPTRIRGASPELGEATDAVLAELGFDAAGIAALRDAGIAGAITRPGN